MVFTDEDKIIIKYLRQKYKQGPVQIMNDHPERNENWTIDGLKSVKKKKSTQRVVWRAKRGRVASLRTYGREH